MGYQVYKEMFEFVGSINFIYQSYKSLISDTLIKELYLMSDESEYDLGIEDDVLSEMDLNAFKDAFKDSIKEIKVEETILGFETYKVHSFLDRNGTKCLLLYNNEFSCFFSTAENFERVFTFNEDDEEYKMDIKFKNDLKKIIYSLSEQHNSYHLNFLANTWENLQRIHELKKKLFYFNFENFVNFEFCKGETADDFAILINEYKDDLHYFKTSVLVYIINYVAESKGNESIKDFKTWNKIVDRTIQLIDIIYYTIN